MSFDWSKHKSAAGEFVKFETIGDKVSGQIVALREKTFPGDEHPTPLIDLAPTDGSESVTLSVNKVDLRIQLAELEPQVSDMLAVEFVDTQKTPNGTKKVFKIRHRQGERPEPEPVGDYGRENEDLSEFSSEPF